VTILDARAKYLAERPTYVDLACLVKDRVRARMQEIEVRCQVTARAKEVESFVKKLLYRSVSGLSTDIHDLAGVRAIVTYADDVERVVSELAGMFDILHCEDLSQRLGPDQLGYLANHCEVRLRDRVLTQDGKDLSAYVCEIQVHTRAANLWSEVSHELIYKPIQDAPPAVKRRIYRIIALLEVVDSEIASSRDAIMGQAGYEVAAILRDLEHLYYKYCTNVTNPELSAWMVEALKPAYSASERSKIPKLVRQFAHHNDEKLSAIYENNANDPSHSPFLFQPEGLAIFERLERARPKIRMAWTQAGLPEELLTEMAGLWGVDVSPVD